MSSTEDGYGRPVGRAVLLVALVYVSASLGLLGPSAIAAAVGSAPEQSSEEVSGLHFLSDRCGTPILQNGVVYVSSLVLDDGRLVQHIRVDVELSANGKVAYERPAFMAVIDLQAQTVALEGTLVNISALGEGVLLKDVGRIVRDLTTNDILSLAGRWMILEGEFEEVCRYFVAS